MVSDHCSYIHGTHTHSTNMCVLSIVSWHLNEDPKLLVSGKYPGDDTQAHVAMSPDGRIVAIATSNNMSLYNSDTAELIDTLLGIHSGS